MECIPILLFICCKILCLYMTTGSEENTSFQEFDVMPVGQEHSFSKTAEKLGFSCTFTYKAQGGTNEKWTLTLTEDNGKFVCIAERPRMSYLFFEAFRMEVSGVNVVHAEVGGESKKPLKSEEFHLDTATRSVRHVQGKFKNHLEKVVLHCVKPKQEL